MGANIPSSDLERVVILGGGFAGVELAKKLSSKKYQIVLLDKNNYHQFQPLFYQVATAGLEPSAISFPLRKLFQKNEQFHFRVTKVEGVDCAVLSDQVKSLDWKVRRAKKKAVVSADVLVHVRAKMKALLQIS